MKLFRLLFLVIVLKGVAFATPFLEDILKKDKINIVAFVTSWCPVCQKTNDYLESFSKKNSDVFVTLFFVDEEVPNILSQTSNFKTNSISFEDSKKFGVDKSVPYILVFDKELKVIKVARDEGQKYPQKNLEIVKFNPNNNPINKVITI